MDKAPGHLTASDFYKFVKCPSWLYWDIFGDPAEKSEVSPMMQRLREGGVEHEEEIMRAMYPDAVKMETKGDADALAEATLAVMKEGAVIYQGTLKDGDWVGRPDLLIPRDEPSNLGAWTYDPVDIKSAFHLSDIHKYQLTFYALLLEKAQGLMPREGKIINAKGETLAFAIQETYSDFFEVLAKILEIRAGAKPEPYLVSGAKESPWFALLKREVVEADDLSRIYKLYRKEYKRLREAGYETVAGLAAEHPDRLIDNVSGIASGRLARIHLQAKSLAKGETFRIGTADLPASDTELHFDIEGDPFRGVEYLHGVLVRKDGKDVYHTFLAEREEDEGKAWTALCDFMEGYVGTPIYHYGWYELDVIKRLSGKYGISAAAAEAFDRRHMIDLNRFVQHTVIFPLHFYSLKDVCRHLGFQWRADDASGANSVLWFQDWLKTGDRKILQKIIDYNEDDVRATAFLKDWLMSKE